VQLATPILSEDENSLSTSAIHAQAVERTIEAMHTHLHDSLSLEDLAAIAYLSPYHFNRVFRHQIGIPPGEFLSALRLQKARHLLLATSLSVIDICFAVGYTSTGSFTTRFTQMVGLSPRLLRQHAREFEPSQEDLATGGAEGEYPPSRNVLVGKVSTPESFRGVIYLGLFPRPIPQGAPVRCTRLSGPGYYILSGLPDGVYYLLAAAFPLANNLQSYLLPGENLLLGRATTPLVVRVGCISGVPDLVLRSPRLTDPPLVMGLPLV
jgi:AraC-like DNA-binding protein